MGKNFIDTDLNDSSCTTVNQTVQTFAHRMRRRIKEHEQLATESNRAAETRAASMLHALTTIRKALLQTAKIKLDDRFHFELLVSDWEGWPRLDLNLVDTLAPARNPLGLEITAHDRQKRGQIQIGTHCGKLFSRMYLAEAGEFERLPVQLKSSIRKFLDMVSQYILHPSNAKELVTDTAPPLETSLKEEPALAQRDSRDSLSLSGADVFSEENLGDDKLVQAVEVQPLDPFT
jgi:hypothetical protein